MLSVEFLFFSALPLLVCLVKKNQKLSIGNHAAEVAGLLLPLSHLFNLFYHLFLTNFVIPVAKFFFLNHFLIYLSITQLGFNLHFNGRGRETEA